MARGSLANKTSLTSVKMALLKACVLLCNCTECYTVQYPVSYSIILRPFKSQLKHENNSSNSYRIIQYTDYSTVAECLLYCMILYSTTQLCTVLWADNNMIIGVDICLVTGTRDTSWMAESTMQRRLGMTNMNHNLWYRMSHTEWSNHSCCTVQQLYYSNKTSQGRVVPDLILHCIGWLQFAPY